MFHSINDAGAPQDLSAVRALTEPASLVCLNARIPVTEAFGIAEWVKRMPEHNTTSIMNLTPAAEREAAAPSMAPGLTTSVTVPVKAVELYETIRRILERQTMEQTAPVKGMTDQKGSRAAQPGMNVLLAEDNFINQKVIVKMLEKRGYRVVVAANGEEALATYESEPFDLVLMDVQMPLMNGLEATGMIRKTEQRSGRRTPIVALTAHAMNGDKERCLAAGMDAYVSKPIDVKDLIETIESLIPGSPKAQKGEREAAEPVMDRAAALNQMGGDQELLSSICELFLREYPKQLESINQAIERGDKSGLEQIAHNLKGTLGVFQAKDAAKIALELELMGRLGNMSRTIELFASLEVELERLRPALVACQLECAHPSA